MKPEEFANQLREFHKTGDAKAIVSLISTTGVPGELLQGMKDMLPSIIESGPFEITNVQTLPFDNYTSITGAPGMYDGKPLRWATRPTYWVVIDVMRIQTAQEKGHLTTTFEFEYAIKEVDGRWRIIAPTYSN